MTRINAKTVRCLFTFVIIVACAISSGVSILAADEEPEAAGESDHPTKNVEFHGPSVHPGYPDAFHTDYILRAETISPNHKYGLIIPDRLFEDDPGHDFVVALDPPQILALLDTDWMDFEGKSHGGSSVEWSSDSSVALVTFDAKWGPGDFILIEFQNGRVKRTIPLGAKIRKLLEVDYAKQAKVKAGSSSGDYDFVFETQESEAAFCKLEGSKLVRVDAYATSDPKGFEERIWRARLRATWDIAASKFVQQKVTRLAQGRD